MWCGVYDAGGGVQGAGCGVRGLGCGVLMLGFGVLGFRNSTEVWGAGYSPRVRLRGGARFRSLRLMVQELRVQRAEKFRVR